MVGPTKSLRDLGVTRREAEVLDALRADLTNAEIAARLYVSLRTVESHVSTLLRKLGAANRRELVAIAAERGDRAGLVRPALPAPLELLADGRRHVGREAELARLSAVWEQAASGQVRVVIVAGEAGIGKSRLVAELAAGVHGRGGRVVLGACFADAAAPYEPFAQCSPTTRLLRASFLRSPRSSAAPRPPMPPVAASRWSTRCIAT